MKKILAITLFLAVNLFLSGVFCSAEEQKVSVSGKFVRASASGMPLTDIEIKITGTKEFTVKTDRNGNYIAYNLPAGGSYTLTPSKAGFLFTPQSKSYTGLTASRVNENFSVSERTYSISGKVIIGNKPSKGEVLMINTRAVKYFTNDDGAYFIDNLPYEGPYIVTVESNKFAFEPFKIDKLDNDVIYNFEKSIHARGYVTSMGRGVPDVEIAVNNKRYKTDAKGFYEISGLATNGIYILAVINTEMNPEPKFLELKKITQDAENMNFSLSGTIAGNVQINGKPFAGAAVKVVSEDQTEEIKTDKNGNYKTNKLGIYRDYVISISSPGYSFSPESKTIKKLVKNIDGQNFTASVKKIKIYGTVMQGQTPVKDVEVSASGVAKSVKTDIKGAYSFDNLGYEKDFTVSVKSKNIKFVESVKTINKIQENTEVNFSGLLSISGNVSNEGQPFENARINYDFNSFVLSDKNGDYVIDGLMPDKVYTIEISSGVYEFEPANFTTEKLRDKIKDKNFMVKIDPKIKAKQEKFALEEAKRKAKEEEALKKEELKKAALAEKLAKEEAAKQAKEEERLRKEELKKIAEQEKLALEEAKKKTKEEPSKTSAVIEKKKDETLKQDILIPVVVAGTAADDEKSRKEELRKIAEQEKLAFEESKKKAKEEEALKKEELKKAALAEKLAKEEAAKQAKEEERLRKEELKKIAEQEKLAFKESKKKAKEEEALKKEELKKAALAEKLAKEEAAKQAKEEERLRKEELKKIAEQEKLALQESKKKAKSENMNEQRKQEEDLRKEVLPVVADIKDSKEEERLRKEELRKIAEQEKLAFEESKKKAKEEEALKKEEMKKAALAEKLAKEEAAKQAKEEERLRKEELKKIAEQEKLALEEAKKKAKEEALLKQEELKKAAEQEKLAKEEAAKQAKEEERLRKEELKRIEMDAKINLEIKKRLEMQQQIAMQEQAYEQEEARKKELQEKIDFEKEKNRQQEQERLKNEELKRLEEQQQEQERLRLEEVKKSALNEQLAKEEAAKQAKEEERLKKEELKKIAEQEKLAKEEEKKRAKEEERLKKEELKRIAQQEKLAKEEEKKRAKEEERLKKEELKRIAQQEKLAKEEEKKRAKEEERLKKEELKKAEQSRKENISEPSQPVTVTSAVEDAAKQQQEKKFSITGRILKGRYGVPKIQIKLLSEGKSEVFTTDKYGYYMIGDLEKNKDYVVTVVSDTNILNISPKSRVYKNIERDFTNDNYYVVTTDK